MDELPQPREGEAGVKRTNANAFPRATLPGEII
jgi:hypothetical protein